MVLTRCLHKIVAGKSRRCLVRCLLVYRRVHTGLEQFLDIMSTLTHVQEYYHWAKDSSLPALHCTLTPSFTQVCMYACVLAYLCLFMYVCVRAHVCVCIYVYMCVCVYYISRYACMCALLVHSTVVSVFTHFEQMVCSVNVGKEELKLGVLYRQTLRRNGFRCFDERLTYLDWLVTLQLKK